MTRSPYEIVEVRRIDREIGRFGGIFRTVFQADRLSSTGRRVMTRSDEIEWRRSDLTYRRDDFETKLQAAHDEVVQFLLGRGWEPLRSDDTGRVTTFRRKSEESLTARLARRALGTGWLLLNGRWIYRPTARPRDRTTNTTGRLNTSPLPGTG